jgi:hypothetical protein
MTQSTSPLCGTAEDPRDNHKIGVPEPVDSQPEPCGYYYDDSTGYEIYDPGNDDEVQDEDSGDEVHGPGPADLRT